MTWTIAINLRFQQFPRSLESLLEREVRTRS